MDTSNQPKLNNIQPPPLLPKGGGAIRSIGEKFGTNPVTGTSSMTIPIATSTGRSGFSPQLSLSYDSGMGNGPFGLGWSLSMPSISRKTDKGIPQYCNIDEPDVFVLSGSEDLVPVNTKIFNVSVNNILYNVQRYRPRVDDLFIRIEQWINTETNEVYWKSTTKDNISTFYGKTSESRIFDPYNANHIFTWLICESYDDKGNIIMYNYVKENDENVDLTCINEHNRICTANKYIKSIKYGNQNYINQNYMFEIVFDYGEHDTSNPKPCDKGVKKVRFDPFSSYRSGFEVRTYRLCQRVLMFHHFPENSVGNNCLIKSTNFTYSCEHSSANSPKNIYSLLLSVTHIGYKRSHDGTYIHKSMPSIDFSYSMAIINDEVYDVDQESLENLPYGLDSLLYQWIDLDGEGTPGIITKQNNEFFYKRNISPISSERTKAKFAPTELVINRPIDASSQFIDLAGDGCIDLVDFRSDNPGFYKRISDNWNNFVNFKSFPMLNWDDQNIKFIDLNGDGQNDILIGEGEYFTWYKSLGEDGFTVAKKVYQKWDEDKGPHAIFSDTIQSIYLADMSGDGLADIVRINSGEVCYWPNIGYGKFGSKVTMDNSPCFDYPNEFDSRRIQLTDIDGSGITDILYIRQSKIHVYFNQSGNSLSNEHILDGFSTADNMTSVTVVDLLCKGTACLVWSSFLPVDAKRTIRYIDLMGENKPYLLTKYTNNMGLETTIEYEPSTKAYLQDKIAGKPWVTKIPFPVHVVKQVKTHDLVSKNSLITRYSYHHGYFDGTDREFRGFGRVDQWDAEEIGTISDNSDYDKRHHVPPVLTKTWFHTGAYLDKDKIYNYFKHEYYKESMNTCNNVTSLLPNTTLPYGLTIEEEREAARSLKGRILRQEVYAIDGSDKQLYPYNVSEKNYMIRLEQKLKNNVYSIFSVHSSETIDYSYERNPTDPRIIHVMTPDIDMFGNVLKSVNIAYPRRIPAYLEQSKTLITYTKNKYTNKYDERDWYRIGIPIESSTYEISGINCKFPSTNISSTFCYNCESWPFTVDFIRQKILLTEEIAYEEIAVSNVLQKRLIECVKTFYRRNKEANTTDPIALPLGQIESLALPCESFKLAFTKGLLSKVYCDKIHEHNLDNILKTDGKYMQLDNTDQWWIPSGRQAFDPHCFYLPVQSKDQFNNIYNTLYDKYCLLTTKTVDPLNNTVQIQNNYRTMSPEKITDPNGNRSMVKFDALGLVMGSSIMGKESENLGDSFFSFNEDISGDEISTFFSTDNPISLATNYLGTATTRTIYNLYSIPVCTTSIIRETHVSDLDETCITKIQVSFTYSDGFGREIQKKIQAEPEQKNSKLRWVGTGTKIYNNKGKIVKQYEPFFSNNQKIGIEKRGVSSTVFYDPLERVIATLHPNHTYEKVVFNSWQQETYDTNDTVILNPIFDIDVSSLFASVPEKEYLPTWYEERIDGRLGIQEQNTAMKTAKHANTPTVHHFDTLGRVFLIITDNGDQKQQTRVELDIEGNKHTVKDTFDRIIITYNYDMLSNEIYQISMDAGSRLVLNNSVKKPIIAWDNLDHIIRTSYDTLHRPTKTYVKTGKDPEIIIEQTIYGELLGSIKNHREKIYQHFDSSGITTNVEFDFKGNIICSKVQLVKDYKNTPDWSNNYTSCLETEFFSTNISYDALNRQVQIIAPHSNQLNKKLNIIRPIYNEANLLEQIHIWLEETTKPAKLLPLQTASFQAVTNINRDAKGQRTLIEYGNGIKTTYAYDNKTFRLNNLSTTSSNKVLQNILYIYDPVGNITHIQDNAQQTIFFKNQVIKPHCDYTYDPIYRLIQASGREHTSKLQRSENIWNDKYNTNLSHPNNGQAIHKYTEQYIYDTVGNIEKLIHHATNKSWTRLYNYNEQSAIEQNKKNNRLSSTQIGDIIEYYTYDNHGNMTTMPHLPLMQWNYKDQLSMTTKQKTSSGKLPEKTYYIYNSSGQRVRKITEMPNGTRKNEQLYLGVFEIYREYKTDVTNINIEYETLHVMDDQQRIALVETNTINNTGGKHHMQNIRFQLNNHLGSATLECDIKANIISYEEYYPYGSTSYQATNKIIKTVAKRYRYIGKERDKESKLYYYGARYYTSWLGRWISCDPVLWDDLAKATQSYTYVESRPIVAYDPDGRALNLIAAAVGAGVGALIGGGIEAGKQLVTEGSVTSWTKVGASAAGGAVAGALTGLTAGANLVASGAVAVGASVAGGATTRAIAGEKQTIGTVTTDAIVGLATFGIARYIPSKAQILGKARSIVLAAHLAKQKITAQAISQIEKQTVQQVEKQTVQQVEQQTIQKVEQQTVQQVEKIPVTSEGTANIKQFEELKTYLAQQELLEADPVDSALKNKKPFSPRTFGSKLDISHESPTFARNMAAEAEGRMFTIRGRDDKYRNLLQFIGEVNGEKGIFEYIVDETGNKLTHQRFIPGGIITGFPNQR